MQKKNIFLGILIFFLSINMQKNNISYDCVIFSLFKFKTIWLAKISIYLQKEKNA